MDPRLQQSGYGRGAHSSQVEDAAANKWAAGVRKAQANQRPGVNQTFLNSVLERLQRIWTDDRLITKKDKSNALSACLCDAIRQLPDPWEAVLYLFTSACDYSQAKASTVSYQILQEFSKWVNSKESAQWESMSHILTQDLRSRVFMATTGKHIPFFNIAVKAYLMDHEGNEYFLPMATALLHKENKLTEAAQIISKLGLHSHYKQEQVLMPLLFTDKVNVLESYVTGSPEQQKIVLELLDHLCARSTDILAFAKSAGVKGIKGEKLNKKVLSKFAMRLIKLFDISPETCPNITENRAMGAVRYLLYKYYIEKSMTHDSWIDMLESTVGECVRLQQQLITELLGYNDVTEATSWADRFMLGDDLLDTPVLNARQRNREAEERLSNSAPVVDRGITGSEDWDAEAAAETSNGPEAFSFYYKMPLASDCISVVSDRDTLEGCMCRLRKPFTTIGIDAEWKPCMGKASQHVALLQLAVDERVFLVDCVALREILTDDEWARLAECIFCDDNVIKIGFGLDTDLRMLTKSFPSMEEPLLRMTRVVDLERLAKTVLSDYDSSMLDMSKVNRSGDPVDLAPARPRPDGPAPQGQGFQSQKREEKGLSLLCLNTLGKPLSKAEQMSNWEKRPLRNTQVTYAAADAYVLLEIYNHLCSMGLQMGLTPDDLEPTVTLRLTTRMERKKAKATKDARRHKPAMSGGFKTPSSAFGGVIISPRELRVVCDTMLQGLGSQLRTCGVDTVIMGNSLRHTEAIQISRRENRIVLTTKGPYDHMVANVGASMTYCVDCTLSAREQTIDVLTHFRVKVNKEDIFSRCSICNSPDFAHIPSADMERLYMYHLQIQQQQHRGGPPTGVSLYDVDQDTRARFLRLGIDPASISFMHNRVRLQVETVPKQEVFSRIDVFFVCVMCGKVYWEGSHHDRVCVQFDNILRLNHGESSVDTLHSASDSYGPDLDDNSAQEYFSLEECSGGIDRGRIEES